MVKFKYSSGIKRQQGIFDVKSPCRQHNAKPSSSSEFDRPWAMTDLFSAGKILVNIVLAIKEKLAKAKVNAKACDDLKGMLEASMQKIEPLTTSTPRPDAEIQGIVQLSRSCTGRSCSLVPDTLKTSHYVVQPLKKSLGEPVVIWTASSGRRTVYGLRFSPTRLQLAWKSSIITCAWS